MSKKNYLDKADKSYINLHKGLNRFDKEFADNEINQGLKSFDSGFDKNGLGNNLKTFDKKSVDKAKNLIRNNPFYKKKS